MSYFFTEADKAAHTQQPTAVKKRRGYTREDGMVFWKYRKDLKDKEVWLPLEVFEARRDLQRKNTQKWYRLNREKALANRKNWLKNNRLRSRETTAKWAKSNRERKRATNKRWVQENPERVRAVAKKSYRKNRDAILAKTRGWFKINREKRKAYDRNRREEHPEKKREYLKNRRMNDPKYLLRTRLQSLIRKAFSLRGLRKSSTTQNALGCDFSYFVQHLKRQFLPGMSFVESSKWHIDHIVPCSSASTPEEMAHLFHYTNLRPLWAADNLAKKNKLPAEEELPPDIHPKVKSIYNRRKTLETV